MKREMIYRTDAMAAIGNLKGLSDADRSKAMQAMLDVPSVQTCDNAVSRQAALDAVNDCGICIQKILDLPAAQPQPEEDCDTCKHGFFGSRQCDNCRMRYPSHYEREEEHHGKNT